MAHVVDVHAEQLAVDKHRVLEGSPVVDVDSQGSREVGSEHSEHKDLVVWKDHIRDSLDRLEEDMLQDILVVPGEHHGLEVSVPVLVDKPEELHALVVLGGQPEVLAGFDADQWELEGSLVVVVGSGHSTDDNSHSGLVHMDLVLVLLVQGQRLVEVVLLELFVAPREPAVQLGVVAVDKPQHRLHTDQLEEPAVQQLDLLVEDIHMAQLLDHSPLGRQEQPVGTLDSWVEDMTSLLPLELLQNHQNEPGNASFHKGLSPKKWTFASEPDSKEGSSLLPASMTAALYRSTFILLEQTNSGGKKKHGQAIPFLDK